MSKMFDSLRRAEQSRKRKNGRDGETTAGAEDAAAQEGVEAQQGEPSSDGGSQFGDEFMRELGMLRNSLQTAFPNKPKRSILFTSAAHDEGVTTLAYSYAGLSALGGKERVLLIELNARRPALFWRLGLTSEAGASHYFSERRPLSSVVEPCPRQNFDVLHIGEKDPTKIQLHLEEAFPRLMEEASARYNIVIIDAPPVVLSPETPQMAARVDGTVIVVHCGKTRREIVQRSINLIEQFEGTVVGVVLNRKKYYIPDFIYQRV